MCAEIQKHAICIQCHNKPEIVNALIDTLPSAYFDFFIHVDKKSSIIDDISHHDNVFFCKRLDVRWGQSSQYKATLEIFNYFDHKKYHYIHLISGNDFLVCSPEKFIDFFNGNDNQYIESLPLDENCTWSWHGQDRYLVWYPKFLIKRPTYIIHRIARVLYREFVMRTDVFKRRRFPAATFYGGSSWFSVTGSFVGWIKEYLSNHKEYIDFFNHGVCSDEVFFSTLAKLSPYKNKITNNCLRYMIWTPDVRTGGPKELSIEDIKKMPPDKYIFARKITDISLIHLLKDSLMKQESTQPLYDNLPSL